MLDLGNIVTPQLDQDQAFSKLMLLQQELHEASDPSSLIRIYKQDKTFNDLFCKSGDPLKNIDQYITASNEGLLQDYLVYGLYGMIGTVIYSKLERIRGICSKYANSKDPSVGDSYSLYLPSYVEYRRLMNSINAIYDAFMKFTKDPRAKVEPIVESLRRAGVKVNYNGSIDSLVGVDWKAVAGSMISRAILTGLFVGAGALAGGAAGAAVGAAYAAAHHVAGTHALMGHAGALIGSDKGSSIGNRGWDPVKVGKACAEMVQIIDKIDRLKVKPAFREDDPEIATKLRFVKNAYQAYLKVVQDVGRGLASACTAGVYNKDNMDY
jgi:hypothetical protein